VVLARTADCAVLTQTPVISRKAVLSAVPIARGVRHLKAEPGERNL
jgi:hypothetical protein